MRKGKLIVSRAGGTAHKGSKTYKVSIPSSWVNEMNFGDERNIELLFDGKSICIRKEIPAESFARERTELGHEVKKITFYDKNNVCSIIYADFTDKTLSVENRNVDAVKLAFGNNAAPVWKDFEAFLSERCVPKERSGIREYLEAIGVDSYVPIEIIKITEGRMAEDEQWVSVEELR